jgi:hypothetical protein
MSDDYDVVIDVLTKHRFKLQAMTESNLKSEYIGWNIMDDIRERQMNDIDRCIRMWREYNKNKKEE